MLNDYLTLEQKLILNNRIYNAYGQNIEEIFNDIIKDTFKSKKHSLLIDNLI